MPAPLVAIVLLTAVTTLIAVAALDRVVLKLRDRGAGVRLTGLNAPSHALLGRLAIHDRPGAALPTGH